MLHFFIPRSNVVNDNIGNATITGMPRDGRHVWPLQHFQTPPLPPFASIFKCWKMFCQVPGPIPPSHPHAQIHIAVHLTAWKYNDVALVALHFTLTVIRINKDQIFHTSYFRSRTKALTILTSLKKSISWGTVRYVFVALPALQERHIISITSTNISSKNTCIKWYNICST